MQKVTELTEPPIVGEFYWVLCAHSARSKWSTDGWVPLLGDLHEDKEIIGFPHPHCHIDHRFISDREIKQIGTIEAVVSKIVQERDIKDRAWKRRKCKRQFLAFPDQVMLPANPPRCEPIVWMRDLELAHLDKQVNCGRWLHRNIGLRTVQPDGEGNRVCPGHGLRWNREGVLSPRVYQR